MSFLTLPMPQDWDVCHSLSGRSDLCISIPFHFNSCALSKCFEPGASQNGDRCCRRREGKGDAQMYPSRQAPEESAMMEAKKGVAERNLPQLLCQTNGRQNYHIQRNVCCQWLWFRTGHSNANELFCKWSLRMLSNERCIQEFGYWLARWGGFLKQALCL